MELSQIQKKSGLTAVSPWCSTVLIDNLTDMSTDDMTCAGTSVRPIDNEIGELQPVDNGSVKDERELEGTMKVETGHSGLQEIMIDKGRQLDVNIDLCESSKMMDKEENLVQHKGLLSAEKIMKRRRSPLLGKVQNGSKRMREKSGSVPKIQSNFITALHYVNYVLRNTSFLSFHSMGKMPCYLPEPSPVDIRDSSGHVVFKVVTVPGDTIIGCGQLNFSFYKHKFVNADGITLFEARQLPDHNPTYVLYSEKVLLGIIEGPNVMSRNLTYKALKKNGEPELLRAFSEGSNYCCFKSRFIKFQLVDPNTKTTKDCDCQLEQTEENHVELTFPVNMPLELKIWTIFISWHAHIWNFADTTYGPIGTRGVSRICMWMSILLGIISFFTLIYFCSSINSI